MCWEIVTSLCCGLVVREAVGVVTSFWCNNYKVIQ